MIKNRAITVAVLLTLAIGIGANTAIFTMLKAMLLEPLPGVENASGLVKVCTVLNASTVTTASYPDYVDYRAHDEIFSSLAASATLPYNLSINGQAERAWGEIVSGNYFTVLGVRMQIGRALGASDDQVLGAHPVCVISHRLWQRRFGGDPEIVGKLIRLNTQEFTIVGVTARQFGGSMSGVSLDIYAPLMMLRELTPYGNVLNERNVHWLDLKGRLKQGLSMKQAQAAMSTVAAQIDQSNPTLSQSKGVALLTVVQTPFGAQSQFLPVLVFLMIVVGLVLLIACANVTSLLLARAIARTKEIAIRLSLGASRKRIITQLLTESLLLSLLGGAFGVTVASWATAALTSINKYSGVPMDFDLALDHTVLEFALALSIATGVIAGLAPALQASNPDLIPALKDEAAALGRGGRKSGVRNWLVAAQMALSLTLLILAGLMVQSLQRAAASDPGFDTNHNILFSTDVRASGYDQEKGAEFYRQMQDRILALPGVKAVSLAMRVPLSPITNQSIGISVPGYTEQPNEAMLTEYNVVGSYYMSTLGLPLVAGREFTAEDKPNSENVVIVNETMAQRYWPGASPIDQAIRIGSDQLKVVGVVRDGKYHRLSEPSQPFMYLPFSQHYQPEMTVHVRTDGDPVALSNALQRETNSLDKGVPVFDVKTMAEHMKTALFWPRILAALVGALSFLAMLLAAVGIYGVVSYNTNQRRHEIGLRMALGAGRLDVIKLVVGRGMAMVLAGAAIGLVIGLGLSLFVSSLLYKISATDPLTYVFSTLILLLVAALASYIPARQAIKLNPMTCLRN
jgi:predicted permease